MAIRGSRWRLCRTGYGRAFGSATTLSAGQIVITANADKDMPALHGSAVFTGMLASNPNVPSVNSGGVTSGPQASGAVLIAPGDLITISGQYFAAAPVSATQLPLTTDLAGTEVLFAGATLPLIYSSSGKILAIVPYNLAPNAQYRAHREPGRRNIGTGGGYSRVPLNPIFSKSATTNSPVSPRTLWSLLTAGTPLPASAAPASPLKPGGSFVIYCTGLGAISQPLDPGTPAPRRLLAP